MAQVLLAVVCGALVAVQIAMNGHTRLALGGPLWAALVNNAIGLVGICLALTVSGAIWPSAGNLRTVPGLHWTAGLLGAAFITMMAYVGPRLGLASTFSLALAGQLVASLVIDHFGWFGAAPRPATVSLMLGLALVLVGAWLVTHTR
jgi:bacterial/archaeal transporter family-2 protein